MIQSIFTGYTPVSSVLLGGIGGAFAGRFIHKKISTSTNKVSNYLSSDETYQKMIRVGFSTLTSLATTLIAWAILTRTPSWSIAAGLTASTAQGIIIAPFISQELEELTQKERLTGEKIMEKVAACTATTLSYCYLKNERALPLYPLILFFVSLTTCLTHYYMKKKTSI